MSDGELKPGTPLFLRAFKDYPSDSLQLSFNAPKEKGRYHLAIWLGTWAEGEALASERLNALGWVQNTRLAYAAPELLEALQEVLRAGDDKMAFCSEWVAACRKADAAIAKAKGEA